MDASVHDFLHDLVKMGGGGENTAVVLASDHGTGFAPLYLTQVLYGLSREPILLIGLLIFLLCCFDCITYVCLAVGH